MPSNENLIAVAFDQNFRHAAEIFSGAADYVQEAGLDWRLVPLNFGFEATLMQLADSGELSGAIGTFVSDNWVAGLQQRQVAAVNLFHFSRIERIPSVSVDDFEIGLQAARHLQQQGARSLAFCGANNVYYNQLRQSGFRSTLASGDYHQLSPGPALAEQLQALHPLPRPLGVFCSSDRLARQLIQAARNQGLHCGKDLLVVGVDNDPSESIFARIGISSFKLPARAIGHLAAQHLHSILSGHRTPGLRVPQAELIPRESSLPSGPARLAQRALNHLKENLSAPELDVATLARSVACSRRTLELAFQQQFQTSPYRMLCQQRLELAQQLLRSSAQPIMEVGRRCGYPEPHHFSAWFKKQCGCAPRSFRNRD